MAKTAMIALRIEPKLKTQIEKAAKADHRPASSFVERVLQMYFDRPKLILSDPQPHHREDGGPAVTLRIAEGWPVAGITAEHAEKLGAQLIEAARMSRRMTPAE